MSSDPSSSLAVEEYRALRATIRERGTVRWIVIAVTFVAWAWLASPAQSLLTPSPEVLVTPILSLIPLVVLAAGFEIVFGLHVGVERVGRYLQARYESGDGSLPQWEHEAMAMGDRPELRSGVDPLASWLFIGAALINLTPFLGPGYGLPYSDSGWRVAQYLIVLLAHGLLVRRIVTARRFAAAQRADDLRFFARTPRQ